MRYLDVTRAIVTRLADDEWGDPLAYEPTSDEVDDYNDEARRDSSQHGKNRREAVWDAFIDRLACGPDNNPVRIASHREHAAEIFFDACVRSRDSVEYQRLEAFKEHAWRACVAQELSAEVADLWTEEYASADWAAA